MYLQFYGFKEAPFNLTPDSKFLFLSHRHQEALAALLFGVQERKGFICLTGEIGCGKTTLCRAMLTQLDPEQVKMCVVLNSYLTDLELLKTINEGFNLPAESDSKKKLIDTLNEYLVHEFSQGHNVVLIIDESQNLRPETLEQIRMISNLETETAKLIQIVLIGQPELRKTLALPELEQLNQRITVRYHIAPLDEAEVAEYIRHRLAVAEPQVDVTFSPQQAVRLIYHYSRGIPRRINVICDRCLLVGYVTGSFHIDDKAVERAVNEVSGDLGRYTPAPASAGGEPIEPADAAAGRRRLKVVLQSLKVAAYFLAIVLGIALATWWSQNREFGLGGGGSREVVKKSEGDKPKEAGKTNKSSNKKKSTRPANEQAALAATGGTTATVAATASPTPAPTPKPTPTPPIYADWQADPDGVLRVANRRLAETAAYLNLLRLWNIEPDLEPFRQAAPEDVAQFDMLKTVQQLNFYNIQSDTLAEAFKLDLPVLVHLKDPGGADSWSVIGALNGEVVELIDPLTGRRTMGRDKLEPLVTNATVLYLDTTGVAGLKPGDQGETVLALQNWLVQEGLFQGTPDGKFGPQTRVAIEKFQQQTGLKETGTIDSLTGAIVASRLNPRRPRLYS